MRDSVNRLGSVVNIAMPGGEGLAILALGMEMIINLFCHRLADALDLGEVRKARARHAARGAEVMQQRLLALGADAGDLVERRGTEHLDAPGAMRADREAVRLVPEPLVR